MRKISAICAAVALILVGCGSGLTEDDLDAAVEAALAEAEEEFAAEIQNARSEAEEAGAEASDLQDVVDDLESQLSELTAERDELVAERDQLQALADEQASSPEPGAEESDDPPSDPVDLPSSELVIVSDGLALPEAASGTVAVVGSQALGDDRIAVVVQNNRSAAVTGIQVSATVRDASGSLVVSGSTNDFQPISLESGEFAIGQLYFGLDLDETPSDGSVEFVVDFEEGVAASDRHRLPIIELSQSGDTFTGVVANPSDTPIYLGQVAIGCFTESGEMTGYDDTFVDRDEIPVGETSAFSLRLFRIDDCAHYLLAASAWET